MVFDSKLICLRDDVNAPLVIWIIGVGPCCTFANFTMDEIFQSKSTRLILLSNFVTIALAFVSFRVPQCKDYLQLLLQFPIIWNVLRKTQCNKVYTYLVHSWWCGETSTYYDGLWIHGPVGTMDHIIQPLVPKFPGHSWLDYMVHDPYGTMYLYNPHPKSH